MKVGDRVVILESSVLENLRGLHGIIHRLDFGRFMPIGVWVEGLGDREDLSTYQGVTDGKVPMAFDQSELELEDPTK